MNSVKIFSGILFTLLFWGVNSCDKPEPTPTLPVLIDTCDACNNFKNVIRTDPDFKNYQNYLDSLYCLTDALGSKMCLFNTISNNNSNITGYILYDITFQIGQKFSVKNNYSESIGNTTYSHLYYSSSPRDTPYLAPITIWCDFNEAKPYNVPIKGETSEGCHYFNTSSKRYIHNYDVDFQGARQLGDTIRLIAPSKKITDFKVSSKDYIQYYCIYKIIVSPDRESAELQVEFYDNNSPRKLVKRIEGYTLKRWHK